MTTLNKNHKNNKNNNFKSPSLSDSVNSRMVTVREHFIKNTDHFEARIAKDYTSSSVKEAYKILSTNLALSLNKEGCRRVIITSALPNEGKTTNCFNLGIALAQMNSKVLLIDSDLRKPALYKLFSLSKGPGFSEVLAGGLSSAEAIQTTGYSNLQVLSAGETPTNPVELLGSAAMRELISEASEQYDFVLLDMPPVNLVADVLTISELVDGTVLVVREGETKHPEFQRALSSLKFAHAKILGIILNDVNMNRIYGSQYGYGKYSNYYR